MSMGMPAAPALLAWGMSISTLPEPLDEFTV